MCQCWDCVKQNRAEPASTQLPKNPLPPAALKGKANSCGMLLVMASKLTHSSKYPRKRCSRRMALWPCTHTCVRMRTVPHALQPSIWLQLLKGMWRKIPSSKAQLQADSINQWDARLQPGCSARSCCCCVNPQCLVTAVKDFSEWTPLPLGKHRVIPARCCHVDCVYVHSF